MATAKPSTTAAEPSMAPAKSSVAGAASAKASIEDRAEHVTVPGVPPPSPGLDSLFGDDEEDSRGPEWCADLGCEIRAMNKFELWLALGTGDLSPATRVWRVGRERWQRAQDIPDLACALKVHAQSLAMASRAANEASPRVLTPESSVLVAAMNGAANDVSSGDDSSHAATPASPLVEPAISTPPAAMARVVPMTGARRRFARFVLAAACFAGVVGFLATRADPRSLSASIASGAEAAATANDPSKVEATTADGAAVQAPAEPRQAQGASPSVPAATAIALDQGSTSASEAKGEEKADSPKSDKPKKSSSRVRAKDGVNGHVAGVEVDRRGRTRLRPKH